MHNSLQIISSVRLTRCEADQLRNVHYGVPYSQSALFTGREDLPKKLHAFCLLDAVAKLEKVQKKFVTYGLGGCGKVQVCLKFAQEY